MIDLVVKLRDAGDHATFEPSLYHTAADCIEKLLRERKAMAMRDAGYDVYAVLEAKLAKAVETLREFAKQKAVVELDDHEYDEAHFENAYDKFVFKARAARAELEKE